MLFGKDDLLRISWEAILKVLGHVESVDWWRLNTVDGSEIRHPPVEVGRWLFAKVLAPSRVVVWDFFQQQYVCSKPKINQNWLKFTDLARKLCWELYSWFSLALLHPDCSRVIPSLKPPKPWKSGVGRLYFPYGRLFFRGYVSFTKVNMIPHMYFLIMATRWSTLLEWLTIYF